MTRSVEQLHVITDKKISAKGVENTNFYSGVFINYLMQNNLWKDDVLEYCFGSEVRVSEKEAQNSVTEIHQKFISTPWQEHNVVLLASASKLWDTSQGEAINFGNLFHEILSKISLLKDVFGSIQQYYQQGVINKDQSVVIKNTMDAIVNHPLLVNYFSEEVTSYNEREIVDIDNHAPINFTPLSYALL